LPLAAALLWRGGLLLQRLRHQLAVVARVAVVRVARQSGVIRLQRRRQVADVGQGVAPVVMGVAVVEGGKIMRRRRVITRLEFGVGAAARVGVSARGGGRVALLQELFAALVGGAPETGPETLRMRATGGNQQHERTTPPHPP